MPTYQYICRDCDHAFDKRWFKRFLWLTVFDTKSRPKS